MELICVAVRSPAIESGMGTLPFAGISCAFCSSGEDLNLAGVIRKHGIYHSRVGLTTLFELDLIMSRRHWKC